MVNTLWNAPEKVTSTPRGSSNSALKKIVAAAIALTLSGEPAEAKTYNKQEFPTEMVANVPWTVSPITENVEQTNIPNYINQAQAAVRKYYPEYTKYFEKIFNDIKNLWWYEKYLLNEEIWTTIELEWLTNEKEIITITLISIENISWQEAFTTKKWISKDDKKYELWNEIANSFINNYKKQKTNVENFIKEIKELNTKINKEWISNNLNETIQFCEKYMPLLKNRLLDYWEIYSYDLAQNWIEIYINTIKIANKKPSQIWQKYINAYNKVKK